jgi:hypothetical protein
MDGDARFCFVCGALVDTDALPNLRHRLEAELHELENELRTVESGDGVHDSNGGDRPVPSCPHSTSFTAADGEWPASEQGLLLSARPSAPSVPGITNSHSAAGAAGPGHGGHSSASAVTKSVRWERLLRGKRLALVFGISGYASGTLPVAALDAADMAAMLVSMGYELITGEAVLNASVNDMWAAVKKLQGKLEDGCTVVVYFAGHGISGFLLPVDANTCTKERACWLPPYCCWLDYLRSRWRSLAAALAAQPCQRVSRFVCSCGPTLSVLTRPRCPWTCVCVACVLNPEQEVTCVSVNGLLSSLGDTLRLRAYSTAVVCLLLDCCRVATSERGLPEGVVPKPPQGCVKPCKMVLGSSRFGTLCACREAL